MRFENYLVEAFHLSALNWLYEYSTMSVRMVDTVKGFTLKIFKTPLKPDAPDGMFPKTRWTYFTYPSGKEQKKKKTLGKGIGPSGEITAAGGEGQGPGRNRRSGRNGRLRLYVAFRRNYENGIDEAFTLILGVWVRIYQNRQIFDSTWLSGPLRVRDLQLNCQLWQI